MGPKHVLAVEIKADTNHPNCFRWTHPADGGDSVRGKRFRRAMFTAVYRCSTCNEWLGASGVCFESETAARVYAPTVLDAPEWVREALEEYRKQWLAGEVA